LYASEHGPVGTFPTGEEGAWDFVTRGQETLVPGVLDKTLANNNGTNTFARVSR
jgi:hypothetical protein